MSEKSCRVSRLCVACLVLALAAVATIVALWVVGLTGGRDPEPPPPWDRFRLPPSLVPEFYNVTLWPRLSRDPDTGLYTFTGESSVQFECVTDTDLILIHSNQLNYTHTPRLTAADGGAAPGVGSWRLQPETQLLVLELEAELRSGHAYILHTRVTGELTTRLEGLYLSHYQEGGANKTVLVSQMHPTHARRTFPCFDEPALKAVFRVTLLHAPGTRALSNGLERESLNVSVGGVAVTRTTFEPTPRMSSYLLALIVCDYAHVGNTQGHTLIRVWARRAAVAQGQGDYALNVTGPVLSFLESYYNISYPLSKSDQIALPDFYFGAMENWGLVTYRESKLLYEPRTSSVRSQAATAAIIAHELAHMWFGNLVTLRWWNEVWLNEGFATYLSYLGADHAQPTWNLKELMVLEEVQRVFAVDALTSSHPLSSPEESIERPEQISEQFDAIAYSKGASVLRMLSDFLSESIFVQGLRSYLAEFSYRNTVGHDLWRHLQQAVEANNVSLPVSVGDVMNRWVLQMGFPVVTIDTSTGTVSQQHFLLDPASDVTVQSPYRYEWLVPIRWMKEGEVQSAPWWLMDKQGVNPSMRSGSRWLLANLNLTGFYRVNYDLGNWERLLTQLDTQHQVIPLINRAQLLDDAFNLARAELLPTSVALRTSCFLQGETDFLPWQAALNNLHYYTLMLDTTEVHQPMQAYMKQLVAPLFQHFENLTSNWSRVPDGLTQQYNQVNAIAVSCRTGLSECQNLTRTWFRQWKENPAQNLIHPNLRAVVYCSAVAAGDAADWDFVWTQFKAAAVASQAAELMAALSCTTDRRLLERLLSFTLDPAMIRKQDATAVITAVASNREGQSLTWDFVRQRWDFIFTEYGAGSFSFASIISGVTARFSTAEDLRQLEEFVERHGQGAGFGSAAMAVEQALERTRANIRWLNKNRQEVLDWFKGQIRPE